MKKYYLILLLMISVPVMSFSYMAINGTEEIYDAIQCFTMVLKGQKNAKEIVSPSGLVVIRNFPSGGFGVRGKDVRYHYSLESIPVNFKFPVKGEIDIDPGELFMGTVKSNIKSLPLITVEGLEFGFKNKDEPATSKVIELCGRIGIEDFDGSPRIIRLNDKEIVLTESVVIDDLALGAWAVFERIDNKYLLRAVIDLR